MLFTNRETALLSKIIDSSQKQTVASLLREGHQSFRGARSPLRFPQQRGWTSCCSEGRPALPLLLHLAFPQLSPSWQDLVKAPCSVIIGYDCHQVEDPVKLQKIEDGSGHMSYSISSWTVSYLNIARMANAVPITLFRGSLTSLRNMQTNMNNNISSVHTPFF